jgi:putative Holliday junction resolvase
VTAAGRILAVDPGSRRIGLALSDESRTLAQPLATLTRRAGKRPPVAQVVDAVRRHGATAVVVGLPLDADGAEGDAARDARTFAADVGRRAGVPVALWDERFTTARALRTVRELGGSTRGRKGDVDALAATLLLQHYLDAQRGSGV